MATQKKFVVKNGLVASGLNYPDTDGTAGQAIVTDAAGNLSFGTAGTAETLTFTGKNRTGSTIAKGTVVYVSALNGNTPEISLARANSSSTMPAFGLATADIADNNDGAVDTFGSLRGLNAANFGETGITFALGDTLYVSASEAGKLTNVPPAGEANLIQNIGKIERATPTTNMTIKVGGSGRTNATPALNDGNIFIGNSSNQSSTAALNTSIVPEGSNLYYTDARADARVALIVDAAPSTLDTLNELAAALGDDANFSTTVTNSIATKLPLAGGTMTGNINFGDDDKAIFGASNDLQIYHDGSGNHTKIENINSTASVSFRSNGPVMQWWDTQYGGYYIHAARNGAVSLAYARATKLATTSTGIDVTGSLSAESISVNTGTPVSSSPSAHFRRNHGAQAYQQLPGLALYWNTSNGFQDNTIVYGASANSSLKFTHADGTTFNDRLIISSSGNVGIGTATPATALDVTGTVTSDGLTVDGPFTVFNNTGGSQSYDFKSDHYTAIQLTSDVDASTGGPYTQQLTGNGSNGRLELRTGDVKRQAIAQNGDISFYEDTGTTVKFHWDAADERLGIGTATPATTLHVRGTASAVGANRSVVTLTDDTSMGINVGSGIAFRGLYTSAGAEANYGGIFAGKANANSGNANGYLSLSYSASGTLTEGVRISESGNVGIGTATPATILDISTSGANGITLNEDTNNASLSGRIFLNNGTANKAISIMNNGNNLSISTGATPGSGSGSEKVRILENGNVGIGTTSPATALEVNGAILAKVHHEVFTVGTIASNIVSLDLNTGSSVVTVASPAANFSLAITNALNTGNTTTGLAIIVTQGGSPFIPNALTINGSSVTINWLGGSAPAGTASKTEIFSFTVINTGGVFTALGSVSTFG